MDLENDDELEAFIAVATASWLHLQEGVWGVRWDHSRRSLDFSRLSLRTLSAWLVQAMNERTREEFERLVFAAGQYFGGTIQAYVDACWVRDDERVFDLRISLTDGSVRIVDLGGVLDAWLKAVVRRDGSEDNVFVEQFDGAVVSGAQVTR